MTACCSPSAASGRPCSACATTRAWPFCLLGEGVAFTAHGYASVVAEQLDASERVVAVELRLERVQDHLADGRTEMLDGARWRWRDEEFGAAEEQIVAELGRL